MKAWVLHDINNFQLETIDVPTLTEKEVLIAVKAVGICGSDIPRIYKTGTYSYPLIPGHEFSGIVEQVGEKVDKKWIGKRVGIFPLIPCKTCIPCQKKQYEMCRQYSYLGSRRDGGFAEYVAVPENNLIELPDNVSYEEAAMMEPMAVSVHSIRRMPIECTDKIVVCGLGTIGMFLCMFLIETGFKNIFVIGNKEFQKETILKMGISEENYCDCKSLNVTKWIMEKTNNGGADVFFECVGKNETLEQAIDLTAPAGKVCLVGNPYSDMELKKSVYWKILRNQLTVIGTWNSSFMNDSTDDWNYVLEKLQYEKINPKQFISHKYSLENMIQGFEIMKNKTEDYIKIMAVLAK